MESAADRVIAALLKHSPAEFAQGKLVLVPVLPVASIVAITLLAVGITWWAVRGVRVPGARDRTIIGALRTGVLLLLGLCLLRPMLELSRAVPQRNALAIILDDSRSMTTADAGTSRLDLVREVWADTGRLASALGERFALRYFSAAGGATPIQSAGRLSGSSARSDLGRSLSDARELLADLPLAGVVLVSDGAHNGTSDMESALTAMVASGVPVHTVGVGSVRFDRDVGVDGFRLAREILAGGEAPGQVSLRMRGVGGERAVLRTEAGGRLTGIDTLTLPRDREAMDVPIRVPADEAGDWPVRVSIEPLNGEVTVANNAVEGMVRVRRGPDRILYVEGEPRPELPFMRRAVADDSALIVTALVRTARGKYLRLGVRDSLELIDGFPKTAEELFRYRGVVLGSVEAAMFTREQLRMLQDFVAVRGGGLLALGGRRAFGEGGYAGTPVDEVLPISFPEGGNPDMEPRTISLRPTAAGRDHPTLALPIVSDGGWEALPALTSVNAPGRPRPGAAVLLEGVREGTTGSEPVLATQRYGRGQAAVLMVQDLWRWQLTADLPEDDASHRAMWELLLRWTVADAPDRLEIAVDPAVTAPGDQVELRVRLVDEEFKPRDDARVLVEVSPPDAPSYQTVLVSDLGKPGEYRGSFLAGGEGRHGIRIVAALGADTLSVATAAFSDPRRGDPGPLERNDALLARIAERTGGRHWDIADLDGLAEALTHTRSGLAAVTRHDLWDAPLMLVLLLLLLGGEWAWRRHRGLA